MKYRCAFDSPHVKMFSLSFLCHIAQVLVLVCSTTTSDIRYVRPADSPLSSCPGQPCLTLHEYVQIDNYTNGTTLQFLPGNHTLQQSFSLVNISTITFEAVLNHSVTNIICKNNVTIHCDRVTHLHIVGLSFILSQRGDRSALEFSSCKSVFLSDTVFQGSGEVTGRAIRVKYSQVTIIMCVFKHLTVTNNRRGGAMYSTGTNLTIHASSFINNLADWGGAIEAYKSSLLLNTTIYYGNSAERRGGAISCGLHSQVDMVGQNMFHNNSCKVYGGAMHFMADSQLNIMYGTAHFHFNEAGNGGAIFLRSTNTSLSGSVTMMKNKAADKGGALHIDDSIIIVKQLTLLDNTAGTEGGAMYVWKGNVILGGNVTIESNTAKMGGGIRAVESHLRVRGNCNLAWNHATYGGATNTLYGTISIQGPTQFTHNTADEDGGAMLAEGTEVEFQLQVNFDFNSAKNGGAMFFKNRVFITLSYHGTDPVLNTSFNSAREIGGVIYNRDNPTISQCSYRFRDDNYITLPNCFIQFDQNAYRSRYPVIVSRNDSAEREGNFMFGGLIDRCSSKYNLDYNLFIYPGSRPTKKEISSKPYSLSLCTNSSEVKYNQVDAYRGQTFTVPLLAEMQYGTTATIVTAITSSTARLETYQTSQSLPDFCSSLNYTVYSTESHEQVVLYPDGPCRDTGAAKVVIDVTLLPCPDGFSQAGEICTCEDRLHDYPVNCTIADSPYLTKRAGLNFWIGVS